MRALRETDQRPESRNHPRRSAAQRRPVTRTPPYFSPASLRTARGIAPERVGFGIRPTRGIRCRRFRGAQDKHERQEVKRIGDGEERVVVHVGGFEAGQNRRARQEERIEDEEDVSPYLGYAFRFVNCVVFLVGPQNLRSQRAVEKIGGVRVGSRPDGGGRDSYVYRITSTFAQP